jgi:inner membrane transporter RhtA
MSPNSTSVSCAAATQSTRGLEATAVTSTSGVTSGLDEVIWAGPRPGAVGAETGSAGTGGTGTGGTGSTGTGGVTAGIGGTGTGGTGSAGTGGVTAGTGGVTAGTGGTGIGGTGSAGTGRTGADTGGAGGVGGAGAGDPAGRLRGVQGPAMMLTSALSNQCGAAIGALAFPVIGPAGVVAVRQWVAAAVMLTAGRPRLRSFTWPQWWPVLLLAAVFATMNLSLYTAIDKLGLGLAVTLEFLGPLTVALATSRRRIDIGCALLAGAGVVVLTRPRPTTDYLGVGLALLAAACWASYILLNRVIGRRVPGVQGPAAASALSALAFVPVGVVVALRHPPTLSSLACAAAAGLLASALPYLIDLLALRRVPAHSFGTFMSVNPVLAAIIGFLILGQSLAWLSWLSIAAIAGANALSAVTATKPQARPNGDRTAVGSPPCESSSSDPAAVSTP